MGDRDRAKYDQPLLLTLLSPSLSFQVDPRDYQYHSGGLLHTATVALCDEHHLPLVWLGSATCTLYHRVGSEGDYLCAWRRSLLLGFHNLERVVRGFDILL